jgi:hypothetical protein
MLLMSAGLLFGTDVYKLCSLLPSYYSIPLANFGVTEGAEIKGFRIYKQANLPTKVYFDSIALVSGSENYASIPGFPGTSNQLLNHPSQTLTDISSAAPAPVPPEEGPGSTWVPPGCADCPTEFGPDDGLHIHKFTRC